MIEYFVHVDADLSLRDLVVVAADIPDRVSRLSVPARRLPRNWRASPAPLSLRAIGDAFVDQRKAAILMVPSVLAPNESNWLINPRHPEFAAIRLRPPEPFHYDLRFFRR